MNVMFCSFITAAVVISSTVCSESFSDDGGRQINSPNDDIRYIPTNCEDDVPTIHNPTCAGADVGWCYHIDISSLGYPQYGFCILEDPLHGLDPGVVAYSVTVNSHTHYLRAGHGMYLNYQDKDNYDVVYKMDMDSLNCIVGYVEKGVIYNTTTYPCNKMGASVWIRLMLDVTEDNATFTFVSVETGQSSFSFKPHFPFVAKAGPLAVNAFSNSIMHVQDIDMEAKTCQDEPTNPQCDGCSFAYNIQSIPVYPLPDHRNLLLWNGRALEMVYSACYIKVVVELPDDQVVRAASKVGDFTHTEGGVSITPGDLYGERSQCTKNKTACMEVKYGGLVTDGSVQYLDRTLTEIALDASLGLTASEVNPILQYIYGADIIENTGNELNMYIQEHVYGAEFGIYCHTVQGNAASAQSRAYNMCAAGTNDALSPPQVGIIPHNWAIRFF